MAMTKKVICQWTVPAAGQILSIRPMHEARLVYLEEQQAAGKTDGVLTTNDDHTHTSRNWADQESAEAYKQFVEQQAAENNLTVVITITDI